MKKQTAYVSKALILHAHEIGTFCIDCTGTPARCVSYRKQTYHFPALHKGDVIEGNEGKDQIDFFYLGKLVQSIRKPLRQQTATTRKVQTGGLAKFKQRRIQFDLPKGTYIVVLREGQDYLFYLGEQVVFRMTGQEKCHPCI